MSAKEDDEPFSRLDVARQGQRTEQRQPFEPADVVKLLRLAEDREDTALADLIRLAMWSGARVAELCSLTAANVKADYFDTSSKTAAGRRQVPIHPQLMPTIQRLAREAGQRAGDPYIIGGQSANKYGDRSGAIGLRFSRLKAAAGYGGEYVFHSIQKDRGDPASEQRIGP